MRSQVIHIMSFPSLNQDENFETFFLPLFFINFTIKLNGCKCVKKDDKRICGLVCVSTQFQKMKEQSSMEPPYTGSSIFGLEVYGPSFGPALHQSTSLCHKKCSNYPKARKNPSHLRAPSMQPLERLSCTPMCSHDSSGH